jgi:hypothetical protein
MWQNRPVGLQRNPSRRLGLPLLAVRRGRGAARGVFPQRGETRDAGPRATPRLGPPRPARRRGARRGPCGPPAPQRPPSPAARIAAACSAAARGPARPHSPDPHSLSRPKTPPPLAARTQTPLTAEPPSPPAPSPAPLCSAPSPAAPSARSAAQGSAAGAHALVPPPLCTTCCCDQDFMYTRSSHPRCVYSIEALYVQASPGEPPAGRKPRVRIKPAVGIQHNALPTPAPPPARPPPGARAPPVSGRPRW